MVTHLSITKADGTESTFARCYYGESASHAIVVKSCDDHAVMQSFAPDGWTRVDVYANGTGDGGRLLDQHLNPLAPPVPQWMRDGMKANGW